MLAISIIFTACNKDTSLTEVKTLDPTEQKIIDFKEKMKTGNKSGEMMTIEDAVWNIEAALNYTYCNLETSEVLAVDSSFVTINVSENGEINFDNIVVAYDQLNSDLVSFIGENNMRLTDIEFVTNSDKSGDAMLKLKTVVTGGPPSNLFSFGSTDYWYPIFEQGKCDAYTGQGIGDDASSKLQKKINFIVAVSLPYGYATDVESIYAGMYNGSYTDYFWSGPSNDCLDPSAMNYWLGKGQDLVDILKPNTKRLISTDYWYDSPYSGTWYHMADFNYGIWHAESIGTPSH